MGNDTENSSLTRVGTGGVDYRVSAAAVTTAEVSVAEPVHPVIYVPSSLHVDERGRDRISPSQRKVAAGVARLFAPSTGNNAWGITLKFKVEGDRIRFVYRPHAAITPENFALVLREHLSSYEDVVSHLSLFFITLRFDPSLNIVGEPLFNAARAVLDEFHFQGHLQLTIKQNRKRQRFDSTDEVRVVAPTGRIGGFDTEDLMALRVVLGIAPVDVFEVLKILKAQPALAPLWDKIVAPREGLTLEDHIRLVLGLYLNFLFHRPLPAPVSRDFFMLVLALHDIGKPIALARGDTSKASEHAHTLEILWDIFKVMGYDDWHFHMAAALVDSELAPYVKAAWATPHFVAAVRAGEAESFRDFAAFRSHYPTLKAAEARESWHDLWNHLSGNKLLAHLRWHFVEQLRAQALLVGLSVADIFNLKLTYYMADAGAYTTVANDGVPQQADKSAFDDLFSFNSKRMTMGFAPSVSQAMHDLFVDVQWFDQLDKAAFKEGAENIVLLDYDGLFSNGEQAGEFLRILEASPQVDRIYLFGHFKPKFFLWAKGQSAKLKGSLGAMKYDSSGIGIERMRQRGSQILQLANIHLQSQNVIVLDGEPEVPRAQLVGMGNHPQGFFHVFAPRLLADRDRYQPSTIGQDWEHIEERLAAKRGPVPLPPEPRSRTAVKGGVRGGRALHSKVIGGGAAFVQAGGGVTSDPVALSGVQFLTNGSCALQPEVEFAPEPTGAEEPHLHIVADPVEEATTVDAPFAVTQHVPLFATFLPTTAKPMLSLVNR